MSRTSSKSVRGKAANYLLSSGIAGEMGAEQAAAALRSMLLGSMALGNLYLQRIVLDPPLSGARASDIPTGFQKLSVSIAAIARALNTLPGDAVAGAIPGPAVGPTPNPYADLSARMAEAMERLDAVEEENRRKANKDEDDEPWDSVTALERELFKRAGIVTDED